MSVRIHATAVARRMQEAWVGVLLMGPSGSGKSDLALRLLSDGWRLVADDYSQVWASGGSLWASAPDILPGPLRGHIEARGLGIVKAGATRPLVRIGLIVACRKETVERLPEPEFEWIGGFGLPRLDLDTRPASATALVYRALCEISSRRDNDIDLGVQRSPLRA